MPASLSKIHSNCGVRLEDIKLCVRAAQLRAAVAANREMVMLYWSVGRDILDR
jgi:hypothetical protein